MSHHPQIVSLQGEAQILLTAVAGRSAMESHGGRYFENMVIEIVLSIAFLAIAGAAIVKAYEWYQDVLYGPYIKRVD